MERPKLLLTRDETRAALGGVSLSTIDDLERRRQLRAVRIGRRVFFLQTEIDRFIEGRLAAASMIK